MALAFKKGSFTTNTGTPPFTQAVTGVGLGVAGEAIILFWTNQTAEGTAAGSRCGIGFAVSSTSRGAMRQVTSDNVSTTVASREYDNAKCLLSINGTGEADFTSFDGTDGDFTVTWSVNPTAGFIIHYVVLGGTDLTNAVVTEVNLNASTGDQAYAHGLGTTPEFGIWATINHTSSAGSTTHATFAIGWAVQGVAGSTKCGSVSINASDGETMETSQDQMRVFASNRPLICMGNSVATVDIELDYPTTGNLFDGTNVTFNQINAPTLNTDLLCLFLAGGQYDAGSFNKCTTANCTDNFTVSFVPKGLMFAKTRDALAATGNPQAGADMGFGAASSTDGTQEGFVSVSSTDAIEPTQADQHTSTTKVIGSLSDGNPGSISIEADLTAMSTTSSLTWTTGTESGAILWCAFGDDAAPPSAGDPLPMVIYSGIIPFR